MERIDADQRTLTLLGRRIDVDGDTAFAQASGIGSLAVGDFIEVYGLRDDGLARVQATRIERTSPNGPQVLKSRGTVQAIDAVQQTFRIGQLTVSYASARLTGFDTGGLNQGDIVTALGTLQAGGGGVFIATEVGQQARQTGPEGLHAELEGVVSGFSDASRFQVGDTVVDASAALITPASTTVTAGARVEVEGTYRSGVLQADQVKIRQTATADPPGQSAGSSASSGNGVANGSGASNGGAAQSANGNASNANNTNNANGNASANANANANGNANANANGANGNGNSNSNGNSNGNGNAGGNDTPVGRTSVELSGPIEAFTGWSGLMVRGQWVDAAGATVSGKARDQPSVGRPVRVTGLIDGEIVRALRVHFLD